MLRSTDFHRSLTFRLVATSIVWVVASLAVAGGLLVFLFRDHIERRFDRQLHDHIEELVAAGEIAADGTFVLTWTPSDPRFNRPFSGWYWQIGRTGEVVARSDSLWQNRLFIPVPQPVPPFRTAAITGPGGEPLRILVRDITFPGSEGAFTVAVAGPVGDIQGDVDRFIAQLTATLGILGLGLVIAALVQVRFGLRPLRALQGALADIRAGRIRRLPETFPAEVGGVVHELNALLDHDAALLERARTHAGNLAHALKTPLTVIGNEVRSIEGERGRLLGEQVARFGECIDRHLSRARAAGTAGVLGARTSVTDAIEDIRFSMAQLHKDRNLTFGVSVAEGLHFRGDPHDLEEMVGNLMDNACKWARRRVDVSYARRDGRLLITVEDDGPGIPEERRTDALDRGRRLDETVPGSGLGLDIVRDLADLYGGRLTLAASSLGGVRAELELPAAE